MCIAAPITYIIPITFELSHDRKACVEHEQRPQGTECIGTYSGTSFDEQAVQSKHEYECTMCLHTRTECHILVYST